MTKVIKKRNKKECKSKKFDIALVNNSSVINQFLSCLSFKSCWHKVFKIYPWQQLKPQYVTNGADSLFLPKIDTCKYNKLYRRNQDFLRFPTKFTIHWNYNYKITKTKVNCSISTVISFLNKTTKRKFKQTANYNTMPQCYLML